MAKQSNVPGFVRLGNMLTTTMLRAGVKLAGFGYPMYLLTVRGRKSGQPRTVPIVIIEQKGRAAGAATLTRGRRSETVSVRELPPNEAARVLQENFRRGNPFARYFGVTAESSLEEFERAAIGHPVFVFEGQ
jgi:hypothetical protein